MSDALDERLEQAWEALEEGGERALELARGLPDDSLEVWVLRATAQVDLGRFAAASEACEQAAALGGSEDAGLLWVRGEIALAAWEIAEAAGYYERILAREREPAALERLALVRDLQQRFDEADELLAEAARLAPDVHPYPPRLDAAAFDRAVEEAARALPQPFQEVLEEVPVVVEPVPPFELGLAGDPSELPPDLLGLFTGVPLSERSVDEPDLDAPRIYLFQRNLERACGDRDELVEQVRITLYHELGHFLGFDEEGVDDLGLG